MCPKPPPRPQSFCSFLRVPLPEVCQRGLGVTVIRVQSFSTEYGVQSAKCSKLGNRHGLLYYTGFPGNSDGKVSACNAEDPGSIPRSGRSPGEGNGNPLQYSCLDNPMDRGAWRGYSPWGHRDGHKGATKQQEPNHHLQCAAALAPDIVTCPQISGSDRYTGLERTL